LNDVFGTPIVKLAALEDYLITPIQRIPRYSILISELRKNTPDDHPDYIFLSQALDLIISSSNLINEKKRDSESTSRLVAIHSMLQFPDESKKIKIIANNRSVLFESTLIAQLALVNIPRCYIVLFNDLLLITRKKKNNLIYYKSYPSNELHAYQSFDMDDFKYIYIEIIHDGKNIDLVMEFEDDVLRLNWANVLQTFGLPKVEDTPGSRISGRKKKIFGLF